MNTRQLIAAAAAATALIGAAGSALAQEATPDTWTNLASSQSRAEVQAALLAARHDGSMAAFKLGYLATVQQPQSRAVVRAETARAIANGELAALNTERYDFVGAQHATTVAGSPAVKAAR